MGSHRSFLTYLTEAVYQYRRDREQERIDTETAPTSTTKHWWSGLVPNLGNAIFTLLVVTSLLWAQSAGAVPFQAESAASTGTIAYQGRLADSSGNPLTSTLNMSFRLYSATTGGAPLWTEQWTGPNGVKVSDGLFNVMLGSLTPIPQSVITGNSNLFLGITVGTDDEMAPRVQLGSVPFAVQALSVPDGSVTTAKIADGAITAAKLATSPVDEMAYTLSIPAWTGTTSSVTVNFGTIELPTKSNLYIESMWLLQNNTSGSGMSATLVVDGTEYLESGGAIPFSGSGLGFRIARVQYIPDMAAGSHTFGVKIDQFPFRSGDSVHIGPGSVMWIRAVPVQ